MVSLGEELKRARELREISLREISDATKISVRILEAIENNNYKLLPGGVFNRNFLRAYAGFIGLDPEIIVRKYQQHVGAPEDAFSSTAPFVLENQVVGTPRRKGLIVLTALLVLLLLLVSVFFFLRARGWKPLVSESLSGGYDVGLLDTSGEWVG